MAVTISTTARNTMCDAFVDTLNTGTIKILTSGDVLLVTLTFGATAFGSAATGVATANAITAGTAVATGTAAKATIHQSDDTQMAECSVGTSGEDINLDSVSITSGQEVGLDSLTCTMPAS